MNRREIEEFIEIMEEMGDEWNPDDVEDVYGDSSLEDALRDRKASINIYGDILNKVLNK